ncbi:MAG TPA: hypothetical protein VFL27_01335 [Candidatus Dormibacteraeota bacterium]|nr:hypothetical protein [Candidatus Dormibacteraeota bacterium]
MTVDDRERESARLIREGLKLGQANLWSQAEAHFWQAAQLTPNASLTWLAAAIACWNQRRFSEAADACDWALRQAVPIRATPQSQEGVARFEARDWAGVERAFSLLLKSPPVETPTYLFLCIAMVRQGRIDEAGRHLMAAWRQELTDSEPTG